MSSCDYEEIKYCLDGHPEIYENLVKRYQGPLLNYLTSKTGSEEQAEEIAQETFIRAFVKLNKLKNFDSFHAWLIGIANNVLQNQQRSERNLRKLVENRPVENKTGSDTMKQSVDELPDKYKEVILLRYYGGLSCNEVADQLGISLSAVTKRLSRAYEMLRQSLSEQA
jgi:RNA polymerase sigma-70 factor (ECF subfamily)